MKFVVLVACALVACGPSDSAAPPADHPAAGGVGGGMGGAGGGMGGAGGVGAMPGQPAPDDMQPEARPARVLARFTSAAELEAFVVPDDDQDGGGLGGSPGVGGEPGAGGQPGDGADPDGGDGSADNEEITHNQESGVDEGGIVKHIGDHLIVLRRGRLYAIAVDRIGLPRQVDSVRLAAEDELNRDVWYDELLVRGRFVFVVGFRYVTAVEDEGTDPWNWFFGATELNVFELSQDGRLQRRESVFLEANDYFDFSNYASRMVGGQLLLYMPYAALRWDRTGAPRVRIPWHLEHLGRGRFRRTRPLFDAQDVARAPVRPGWDVTFHTLVRCDAEARPVTCTARSAVGGWGAAHYVTPTHAFVQSRDQIYALPLDGGDVRTHAMRGQTASQFAFHYEDDRLHVLVQIEGRHFRDALVERLALPLDDFDGVGQQDLDPLATEVVPSAGWIRAERFTGGWALAATYGWYEPAQLVAQRLSDGLTVRLPLEGDVTRIAPMPGVGALIVEQGPRDVALRTLSLDPDGPAFADAVRLPGSEGEWRSHGFFFQRRPEGGRFGVAMLGEPGLESGWWGGGASNLAFFDVQPSGHLDLLGAVEAGPADETPCEVSCIDWYGNTRPIFLGQRVFALMGSELAEVGLSPEGLTELGPRVVLH